MLGTTNRATPAAKTSTGITGFDEITGGGLPCGDTTLVAGGPGSGKTVFSLQSLVHGATYLNEPGIFVAFEEPPQSILTNAASFGWAMDSLTEEQLCFIDARISPDSVKAGQFDLSGLLAGLASKARAIGAKRIVLDAVDVLLDLLDDPFQQKQEIYRILHWLEGSGLTGIVTYKLDHEESALHPQYRALPFMAGCTVVLDHRMAEGVSLRTLRVLKYRGSGFSENEFPLIIGPIGIEVAGSELREGEVPIFTERVSSGVERLDTMMSGGYLRGSSVLVTGRPGTAKSSLCGSFAAAACLRGESVLYAGFDESGNEIVRNLASIGVNLGPHLASGRLLMHSGKSESRSAEAHLLTLRTLLQRHQPRCLVIDPLSAIVRAGGAGVALSVAQRLLWLAKMAGVTVMCSSLLEGNDPQMEATAMQISTIADVWIHLSYVIQAGERNRALTIIKARGTRHSNQVREMILSMEGITFTDVYSAGGEVLMGTLRWQKEGSELRERELARLELERQRRELALAEAEAAARVEAVHRELEVRRANLAALEVQQKVRTGEDVQQDSELRRLRGADGLETGGPPEVALPGVALTQAARLEVAPTSNLENTNGGRR